MELRLDHAAPLLIIAAALSGVATGTTERDIANGAAGASVKCATTSPNKSVQLFTTTSQPELEIIKCGHLSNDLLVHCTTLRLSCGL